MSWPAATTLWTVQKKEEILFFQYLKTVIQFNKEVALTHITDKESEVPTYIFIASLSIYSLM